MPYHCYNIDAAQVSGNGPWCARSAIDRPTSYRTYEIVHPGVREWCDIVIQPDDLPTWYVTDDGRTNRLRFLDSGGAVFTSREIAEAIAERANAERSGPR